MSPQFNDDAPGFLPTPNPRLQRMVQLAVESGQLNQLVDDLGRTVETKEAAARQARDEAARLRAEAEIQRGRRDQFAEDRAKDLLNEAAAALASARRITTAADGYRRAIDQIRRTQASYLQIVDRMDGAGPNAAPDLAADGLDAEIERASADLRGALAATAPPREVMSNGVPTGRLPHLSALTYRLNEAMNALGTSYRFTPDLLERTLRAEFRRVVSTDGLILPVGESAGDVEASKLKQVWIQLRPGDLTEIIDPEVKPSEMIHAGLPQGGQTASSTLTRSFGTTGGAGLSTVTAALPEGSSLQVAGRVVAPGAEVSRTESRALTTTKTTAALDGAVEDNRGDALLCRAEASYAVAFRTGAYGPWTALPPVDRGAPTDADALRVWISGAYSVPPAEDVVTLADVGEAPAWELPEHALSAMNGLNGLTDRVAERAAAELGGLDRIGYDQIRGLITEDLPGRLRTSASAAGLGRLIYRDGRPAAYVHVHTRVDRASAVLLGEASTEHWQERLRVGFTGAGGAQAFETAVSASVSAGPGGDFSDFGAAGMAFGPSLNAGRNVGREDSLSAGGTAIHPSVQRYTGPTQGYRLQLQHRVTIHPVGRPTGIGVDGTSEAVLRIPENDAFRYGLPTAAAALRRTGTGDLERNSDHRVLLRGDPRPAEEELRLPTWLGDGPGRMRGAGPALIRRLEGTDQATGDLLTRLAGSGLIPALNSDGTPRLDNLPSSPEQYASQLQNLERLSQHLSQVQLETSYDEACQGGVLLDLRRHRAGLPPDQVTLRIAIHQQFDQATTLGVTDHEPVVNLDIGSNSTARTIGRDRSYPWGGRIGVRETTPGQGAAAREAGVGHSRAAVARSHGAVNGRMVNQVTLTESQGEVAVFSVPHRLVVTEVTRAGDSEPLVDVAGRANVLIAKNLCLRPERQLTHRSNLPDARRPQPVIDAEVLEKAQLLHLDARNPLAQLQAALPAATRTDSVSLHHLAAFMSPRSLIAHPEWLTTDYRTRLAVSPAASRPADLSAGGLAPREATVALRGQIRDVTFAGASPMVTGDINLTLRSFGVTTGSSRPRTTDGAVDAGLTGAGAGRTSTRSESVTTTETQGWERLIIRLGQHYQFEADLGFEAEIRSDDAQSRQQESPVRRQLPGGRVLFSLTERDALQHYGRGQLDLPLEQVADATERLLTGELELDGRTTTAMIYRYHRQRSERQQATGSLTGLAADHGDRQLQAVLRKAVGLPAIGKHRRDRPDLQQTMIESAQLSTLQRAAHLAEHYATTMAGSMITGVTFADPSGQPVNRSGERLGPYAAARQAIGQIDQRLLADDPVLAESLFGDLARKRWLGQLDDLLDPNGFQATYPLRVGAGKNARPQELRLRIKAVFDGPAMIDAKPDGTPATPATNALNLLQGYDYRERSRTSSSGVKIKAEGNGQLEDSGLDGAVAEATLQGATDRNRSTSATTAEQLTRMQRLAHHTTVRVERGLRLVVEAERVPVKGAATIGQHRAMRSREQQSVSNIGRAELTGRVELLVPKDSIDLGPQHRRDGVVDHRRVELPAVVVEGSRPHLAGEPERNTLYDAVTQRLGRSRLLTEAGVERYRSELAMMVSASARNAAFQRLTSPEGHTIVPGLPVPGHRDRKVYVNARASVSDVSLIAGPSYAEKGEVDRSMHAAKTSMTESRLLPGSLTSKIEAGAGVSAGATVSARISETITDTTGKRNETTMFEAGDVVTARVRLDYRFDYERRRVAADQTEKVEYRETQPNAARGEAYVTMFASEYDEMIRKMEAGRTGETVWNPTLHPAGPPKKPILMRADEAIPGPDGQPQYRPYQPLLSALAQARAKGAVVDLRVTERGPDQRQATERQYLAHPDGTLRGHQDGGFAAAFATVNPRLVAMAEGARIDLRALHRRQEAGANSAPDLTTKVCAALEAGGFPPEALLQARQALPPRAGGEAARRTSAEHGARGISNPNRGGADGMSI